MGSEDENVVRRSSSHKSSSSNSSSRKKEERADDDSKDGNRKESEKRDDDDKETDRRNSRRSRRRRRKSDKSRSRNRRRSSKDRSSSDSNDSDSSESSDDSRTRRRRKSRSRRRKRTSKRDRRRRKKRRRKYESSSSSDSSSSSSGGGSNSDSDSDSDSSSLGSDSSEAGPEKVINKKLMAKLEARGETLEERKERRARRRAAKITSRFGYTPEENPFNDPNLHETFKWSKKAKATPTEMKEHVDTLDQIDNIRLRREERFRERDELERLRAEESRMKELEHYDEWAKKEEAFHLQQQRQRSAIRLVEGREKPIDVLAKNLLLFGLADDEQANQAKVKYQERHNPLVEMKDLEAELEEPTGIVKMLKLAELRELLSDLEAFRTLERQASSSSTSDDAVLYWDSLHIVVSDEIKLLQNGGEKSTYGKKMAEIESLFKGQSRSALVKMKEEVETRLRKMASSQSNGSSENGDTGYWRSVNEQLDVYLAKVTLSEIHAKMLVRQLERLELKRDELKKKKEHGKDERELSSGRRSGVPEGVSEGFGDEEQEMAESDEIVQTDRKKTYSWQNKYRGRKPRYFNRVKTGYDWNKYNQTHYDHDNPPPKIVQGYKFNIFYPDLVDPTKTPQYFLEPADSDEFCIIRFQAGAPYEDIAFKILNREWNRSRKRGFKSSFQRGILSLYFNFKTHWYRR